MERDNPCRVCFGCGYIVRERVVRTGPMRAARLPVKCVCPACAGRGEELANDPPAVRQDREEWAAEATFWR